MTRASPPHLVFKALQCYSNGDIVRWIETSSPGQPAPDYPAPVLTLTSGATSAAGAAHPTTVIEGNSSDGSLWLSVAALILSLASVVVVMVMYRPTPTRSFVSEERLFHKQIITSNKFP
jgi:hypothetical protein